MKLVSKKGAEYTNQKGEVKNYINFYIELDNGTLVAIRPCFNADKDKLKAVAEKQ